MAVTVQGGPTLTGTPVLSRNGRQIHDYYVARFRERSRAADELRSLCASASQIKARQAVIRAQLEVLFGPMPTPKPPLNQRTVSTLTRTGYTVENVLYESLPGWLVSANLYVPSSGLPAPGVLVLCGHADTGKASSGYQTYAQALCKLGYVALIADCVGQGERRQFGSSPVAEHNAVNRQLQLVGWSGAGLQTWDALRGVDYLLTRAEVNPAQLGVCGNSGGGTQAAWLAAYDTRLTMAAPSCFVTTFLRNLENELYADHEQLPVRALEFLLDCDDILLACAPKALGILTQRGDYFDSRGSRDCYDRLRCAYELLGAPAEALQFFVGNSGHGLSVPLREAAYKLFSWATGGTRGTVEPAVTIEPEANLLCTATGNVFNEPGAAESHGFMLGLADSCAVVRGSPRGETLRFAIRTALRMPDESFRAVPPDYRTWISYWAYTSVSYPRPRTTIYAVETEPGILCSLYQLQATGWDAPLLDVAPGTKALLYIAHASVDQEIASGKARGIMRLTSTHTAPQTIAVGALRVANTATQQGHTKVFKNLTAGTIPAGGFADFSMEAEVSEYGGNIVNNSPLYVWAPTTLVGVTATNPPVMPPHGSGNSWLTIAGASPQPFLVTLFAAEPNTPLFCLDLRDVGENKPETHYPHADDAHAQAGEMLGEPMLGRLVWDILRVLDLLASHGYTDVHVVSRQNGAIPACIAAVLDPRVTKVTTLNALTRWHACAIAKVEEYNWPLSRMPYGVLNHFDLPDVYAELGAKLTQNTPWGAWLASGGF